MPVPREQLEGLQKPSRDLANVDAMRNHVWSLLLQPINRIATKVTKMFWYYFSTSSPLLADLHALSISMKIVFLPSLKPQFTSQNRFHWIFHSVWSAFHFYNIRICITHAYKSELPGILHVKSRKASHYSMWTGWIHEFMFVKTCLLIPYDIHIYAIISFEK